MLTLASKTRRVARGHAGRQETTRRHHHPGRRTSQDYGARLGRYVWRAELQP
ncbi:hypothetical protein IF2G_08681 [Cordyceps javanica]|nr:hypothetical protein IF2G_08681 [Cordyceps javanica]